MKKNIYSIVFLLPVLLTACNLPSSDLSATPDVIKTMVVQSLTSQANQTMEQLQRTTPTNTPLSEIPATPSPTQTATLETPSETSTVTLTPTRTLDPNDPKAGLGDPTWKNTFDSSNAFGLQTPYQDDFTRIAIETGVMSLSNSSYVGYLGWRLTSPALDNFYLEAPFKVNNCSGGDEYGLVFRAPDYSSGYGYYFHLTCNGQYNLIRWDESGINPLMGWGTDAAILSGSNQINTVGVQASASTIKLFINGKFLVELSDSRFTNGNFGVFIAGYSGNISVSLEEMAYWDLP